MSYNIAAGHGDLERVAQTIEAGAPDLVALQEVDVHWAERSQFVDQAAALSKRLKMEVQFAHIYQLPGASSSQPTREYGLAVLSKYQITRWSNHQLTRLSTQTPNPTPAPMPG